MGYKIKSVATGYPAAPARKQGRPGKPEGGGSAPVVVPGGTQPRGVPGGGDTSDTGGPRRRARTLENRGCRLPAAKDERKGARSVDYRWG